MTEYFRNIDNISFTELAKGICSNGQLTKLQRREKEINAVLFYYITKRLYVSPERFLVLLDKKEYNYFAWLHNMYEMIRAKDYVNLQKAIDNEGAILKQFKKYLIITRYELSFFRYIVKIEVEKDEIGAFEELKKSISFMTTVQGELAEGRYSAEELNRFMNYLVLALRLQVMQKEQVRECFENIIRMTQYTVRDPIEESKIYPRVVCFLLRTVGELYSMEEWRAYLQRAIDLLCKTGDCFDLPAIVDLLCRMAQESDKESAVRYENWRLALREAYCLGEYNTEFNIYDSHDDFGQMTLLHEYLKRGRLATLNKDGKPYTQDQMSEDIMDVYNYARNELGYTRPSKEHLIKLTERMHVSGELFQGSIISSQFEDYWLMTKIRHAGNIGDIETMRDALSILSGHLDRNYVENRQFLDQEFLLLDELSGNITLQDSIVPLIRILEYTTPYKENDTHIYSALEIDTIYKIVRAKRLCGLLQEEDVQILWSVRRSEKRFSLSSWNRTGLLYRLLAGICQVNGDTETGCQLARECLKDMILVQNAHVMADCLDIYAECSISKDPDYAKKLIQATYWVCDLYRDEANKRNINRLHLRQFGALIEPN